MGPRCGYPESDSTLLEEHEESPLYLFWKNKENILFSKKNKSLEIKEILDFGNYDMKEEGAQVGLKHPISKKFN